MSLASIQNRVLRKVLGNSCLVKATLAINAGGAATIKNTGTILYSIAGLAYTKAVLAAQSFAVTHGFEGFPVVPANVSAAMTGIGNSAVPAYVQPINTTVFYVVALDAAGNVGIFQGSYDGQPIVFPNDLTKIVVGSGAMPFIPSTHTAIGVVKVTTNGATTFTPGTTLLDAAGLTVTYTDVIQLPESV